MSDKPICNKCGSDMFIPEPKMLFMSNPPKQKVVCTNCDNFYYKSVVTLDNEKQ